MTTMEKMVNRQLVKYAAGRCVWCPRCHGVMDQKRTVVATVHDGDEVLVSYTLCGNCWDPQVREVGVLLAAKAAKVGRPLRLEVVAGRQLWKRATVVKAEVVP